jgi:hypothetical protein
LIFTAACGAATRCREHVALGVKSIPPAAFQGSHLWRPNGVRFASDPSQRVTSDGKPFVHAQEI